MDAPEKIPFWLLPVALVLLFSGIAVYAGLIRRIRREGGKTRTDRFNRADDLLAALLATWLGSVILRGFALAPKPVHEADIVDSAIFSLIIVCLVGSFLHFRGIHPVEQFGLKRLRFDRVLGTAFALILAAFPLVGCVTVFTQNALGTSAKPQEVVTYFLEASQKSNYAAIITLMVSGVLLAPVAEEFLFRGFFYGILKRHFGMVAGIGLNAALFAAIHLNETSLPALFLLAVCFTLAYEATGSLLVNICMHGFFNLANLLLLLLSARHPLP